MAYIKLPEFDEMTPEIQKRVKPSLKKKGKLDETTRLLSMREDIYFATNNMMKSYLFSKTELPFSTKERIAILVSMENSCTICVDAHKAIAQRLGMSPEQVEHMMEGIDSIDCGKEEKLLLAFCVRASGKESYKIMQSDIDSLKNAGYSDTQILEAVAITGYFNYINTLTNALGVERLEP